MTTQTPTSKGSNSAATEQRSYILVGASNQLNRSALLNIGRAFVPGDIKGKEAQWYVGLTLDYNLLKDVGIVSK